MTMLHRFLVAADSADYKLLNKSKQLKAGSDFAKIIGDFEYDILGILRCSLHVSSTICLTCLERATERMKPQF